MITRWKRSGPQHLERDGAVVPDVVGEIDRGHATAPELALDCVAVGQNGAKLLNEELVLPRHGIPAFFMSAVKRGSARIGSQCRSTLSIDTFAERAW